MVIIDMEEHCGYLSPEIAFYFQSESFTTGTLKATKEPFKKKQPIEWHVPNCLQRFARFEPNWRQEAQPTGAG